ncbi:MAG: 50S ribosomal protein L18 [Nitrososphaerales archaeon]
MSFTPLLRRIREDKTNYRKRKALLIGKHVFAAVRISNQNVMVQMLKPSKVGDQVLVSVHSKELTKHGWQGSRKNIPACYLTGLLAGKKAVARGVKDCVLYAGNRRYAPKMAASVKGVIDAGVNIPVDKESLPTDDRITGKHIADYANALKDDKQAYKTRFSGLIKEGLTPEGYPEHFDEVKSSILGKPVAKKEVKKVEVKKDVVKEVAKGVPEKKPEAAKQKVAKEVKKAEKPAKKETKKIEKKTEKKAGKKT